MECKYDKDGKYVSLLSRINRNIVECKYEHEYLGVPNGDGINRNIVECKYADAWRIRTLQESVLIETLWNVNRRISLYTD